jgi:hypothetical protein
LRCLISIASPEFHGSFTVWARNLDRALQLQAKTGAAYEFNLRNYQVDLATLDEVNSTDDSTFRVEMLTPAQFHFATSLGGIDFRPEMLSATYNNVTVQLSYTVNGVRTADGSIRSAGRYVGQVDADGNPVLVTYSDGTVEQALEYQSDVKTMIGLLQRPAPAKAGVMEQYIVTSRRFAVRMAEVGKGTAYRISAPLQHRINTAMQSANDNDANDEAIDSYGFSFEKPRKRVVADPLGRWGVISDNKSINAWRKAAFRFADERAAA